MAAKRTSRGLDRLVNFSDATVAIAITLLILPLVDLAPDVGHESLGAFWRAHNDDLISFAITFAVIGRFWMVHHSVFEYVIAYSRPLVMINFVWLVGIVFLPFSANVLSWSEGEPAVTALYIGTMVLVSVSAGAIDWVLLHDPELSEPGALDEFDLFPAALWAGLLALALVVAVLFPRINLYAMFLLFLGGPLFSLRARLRGGRSTPTSGPHLG